MNLYQLIRPMVLISLSIYIVFKKNTSKKNSNIHKVETFENFQKDSDGLYPWEKDTDCSPNNIPADAKIFKEKNKIRRGHW